MNEPQLGKCSSQTRSVCRITHTVDGIPAAVLQSTVSR
jgi:hypothetical protein